MLSPAPTSRHASRPRPHARPRMRTLIWVSLLAFPATPLRAQEPPASAVAPQQTAPAPAFQADQVAALSWRNLGPVNMGGRVTDFEASGHTWYIGTAAAGVWKTTNRGTTWTGLFQHEAVSSIGDVAVAPANPDIVWVGTGEDNARNSVSWGDGVYKSTDGGSSWTHMGLRESFQIGHIAIHPENPDIVFVAALGKLWGPNRQRGIFRTKDGGMSWEHVLYLDDDTGCIDVRFHPKDPKVLLACMYERRRNQFDDNDPEVRFGEKAGLFRSADAGDTWERVTEGLPTCQWGRAGLSVYGKNPDTWFMIAETERSGWTTGTEREPARRGGGARGVMVGLQGEDADGGGAALTGVTDDGPAAQAGLQSGDVILKLGDREVKTYSDISAALRGKSAGEKAEVTFRRGDDEKRVEITFAERPAAGGPAGFAGGPGGGGSSGPNGGRLGGQNPNVQDEQGDKGYETGGVFRSDDAGLTWRRLNSLTERPFYYSWIAVDPNDDQRIYCCGTTLWASSNGGKSFAGINGNLIHVDFHTMWIDPQDSNHLVATCDGGVNISYDRARTWEALATLSIGQPYHVDTDNRQPYNVFAGLQDNGTWGGPSHSRFREGIGFDDWFKIFQGDGFGAAVDQDNPDVIIATSQNGGLGRFDRSTNRTSMVSKPRVRGKTFSFNWDTPFFLSPHNSKILYFAGNYAYRSFDQGRNSELISDHPLGLTETGTASAFAESPRQAGLLYLGTADGALWRTEDHGRTWTALHGKLWSLPGPRYVSSLHPSVHNTDRVYATFDGHRQNDFGTHVFVSNDRGNTWRSLVANLPAECAHVLCEDQVNQDLLFLGTEVGCWVSLDRGQQWFRMGKDLPTGPVRDLVIQSRDADLVAATHARGIWIADIAPLRQFTAKIAEGDAYLFAPENVIQWRMRSRGTQGDKNLYGANPPSGATIYVWFKTAPQAAPEVTIHDVTGQTVATLRPRARAGLQALQWSGGGGGGGRGGRGLRGGGGMAQGTYSARMTFEGTQHAQIFTVSADPNDARDVSTTPTSRN